jgi:hypothetical protein
MTEPDAALARDSLRGIIGLARRVAAASGPHDELALRNRAVEIGALAETLLWSVAPDTEEGA